MWPAVPTAAAAGPVLRESTGAPHVPTTNRLPPVTAGRPAARHSAAGQDGRTAILTALSALAVVLGLFLLVAWLIKRRLPAANRPLPVEVVQLLGRTALADRQYLHLIRFGNKLLLVAVSAAGADSLTEIDDPVEVDRLAGLCQQLQSNSTSAAFRQVLQQFARERPPAGLAGVGYPPPPRSALGHQAAREVSHG
ncbi:MAG: hypothetical protein A2W31_12410 [Planctomycetes bacterium RBG_16_64_10]|nr:MAG: hypothetical protein A2W31_12410 [Planctomycetes bacterium RBG_16_64_10]